MKCPDCNGTGKIELLTSTKACAGCGGSGTMPDRTTFRSEGVCLNIGNGNVAAPFGNAACDAQYPTVSLGVSGADEAIKQLESDCSAVITTHREAAADPQTYGSIGSIDLSAEIPQAYLELKAITTIREASDFRKKWLGAQGKIRSRVRQAETKDEFNFIMEIRDKLCDAWLKKMDEVSIIATSPQMYFKAKIVDMNLLLRGDYISNAERIESIRMLLKNVCAKCGEAYPGAENCECGK